MCCHFASVGRDLNNSSGGKEELKKGACKEYSGMGCVSAYKDQCISREMYCVTFGT